MGAGSCRSCGWRRLRDLRHPMSVDLWVERVAAQARVVLVRLLGGYDWWAYGCDRLAALARERGIALALLPGECREADARLAALSTVPAAEQAALLACFREGGPENMRRAARAAGAARRGGGGGARRRGRCRGSGSGADGRMLPLDGGRGVGAAAGAGPLLSLDAARGRPCADRRAGGGAGGARGSRRCRCSCRACATPAVAAELEPALRAARAGGDRDGDGLRGGGRRRVAVRPARGAGLPGGAGDDAARGLGGRGARAGAGGSGDARGAAGARRAGAGRGGLVQGGGARATSGSGSGCR